MEGNDMELEHIVWGAIILNTILQFGDIVVCRFMDCGSKNHESEYTKIDGKWW